MPRDSLALILAQQAAEATRAALEMRDRYIRAALRAGWSARRVASAAGMQWHEIYEIQGDGLDLEE